MEYNTNNLCSRVKQKVILRKAEEQMAYIEFKNVVKAYQMGEILIQELYNTNFEI